jgi:hypothetical protein
MNRVKGSKLIRNLSVAHEETKSSLSSYKDRRYTLRNKENQSLDRIQFKHAHSSIRSPRETVSPTGLIQSEPERELDGMPKLMKHERTVEEVKKEDVKLNNTSIELLTDLLGKINDNFSDEAKEVEFSPDERDQKDNDLVEISNTDTLKDGSNMNESDRVDYCKILLDHCRYDIPGKSIYLISLSSIDESEKIYLAAQNSIQKTHQAYEDIVNQRKLRQERIKNDPIETPESTHEKEPYLDGKTLEKELGFSTPSVTSKEDAQSKQSDDDFPPDREVKRLSARPPKSETEVDQLLNEDSDSSPESIVDTKDLPESPRKITEIKYSPELSDLSKSSILSKSSLEDTMCKLV